MMMSQPRGTPVICDGKSQKAALSSIGLEGGIARRSAPDGLLRAIARLATMIAALVMMLPGPTHADELGRLFFTYIVPVNVVSITYDGVVSVLRARSATRYAALFAGEDGAVQVTRLAGRILPLTLITLRAR